ncbi:DUF1189 domain-containing protein [Bacillus carboniphilus]|uniref:DUF1189 domain-containing protein n=1 Tax=Bacillus carboniphilus TaxID=86663 RepID=A0ABP3GDV8_9BACI
MNIFKQFYKSLYSPKDVATFRFQGIGKTILYVFFLALLSIIPTFYNLSSGLTNAIEVVGETIEQKFPDFTIENGTLTSNQDEPVEIRRGDFRIFFDSTGETEIGDINSNDEVLAILKHDIVLASGGTVDSYSYSLLEDMDITKQDVQTFLESVDSALIIFLPILFVIMYIFSAGLDFLEITILAVIGLIVVSSLGRDVKYGQLWRLTAYSITLPTVFFMIMSFLKTNVPGALFIHWGITIIFLYLTIKEIPAKNKL